MFHQCIHVHVRMQIKCQTVKTIIRLLLIWVCTICSGIYNLFLVYCRELAPGTVSLSGDRAQGDDSKYDSHYTCPNIWGKYNVLSCSKCDKNNNLLIQVHCSNPKKCCSWPIICIIKPFIKSIVNKEVNLATLT